MDRIATPASTAAIVHALPHRARLRVPWIQSRPRVAESLIGMLNRLPGVLEATANPSCASLTVHHEPPTWTAAALCRHIDAVALDLLAQAPLPGTAAECDDTSSSWYELSLSSLGMAVGLMKTPLAPLLLPFCLAGSAVQMVTRAYGAFIREGRMTVDVLDTSAAVLLAGQGQLQMAMFMIWLINMGDYIRDATVSHAHTTVKSVLAYQASTAWLVKRRRKVSTPVDRLAVGDTIVVYAGDRIPVDGQVVSGMAVVDQRALTGESLPIEKAEGAPVFAATVVQEGTLYIRTTQVGDNTEAAKIVRLVEQAPAHETAMQNYAERWANDLVPYSFLGAGLRALFGGVSSAASVLVIDYGTGIRVAAPTAVLATMANAVRQGILFKDGRSLEALAAVDAVVFDKTGTLSTGLPRVLDLQIYGGATRDEVLALAASAEERLNHPVARAIVQAAVEARLEIPAQESSRYTVGLGVAARIDGSAVHVGCTRYMEHLGIALPQAAQRDGAAFGKQVLSPVCVARDRRLIGLIGYADTMRSEAKDVVNQLRALGMKEMVMLTGDQQAIARHAARAIGMDHFVADLLPAQKVAHVKDLQRRGFRVAVVGDGINDSPALAHADVGIAVTGGADVARETAHVVLLNGDLRSIPLAIGLARDAVQLIQDSWRIISVPNTVALVLACGGLLGPGMATLLSNGAAIVATGHALRPVWDVAKD